MSHVRGHVNWWEQPIREIDFGRLWPTLGTAFGQVGQQLGQAFRQIGAFGTQPISFRPAPQRLGPAAGIFPQQLGPMQPFQFGPEFPPRFTPETGRIAALWGTAQQGRPIALPQLQDQVESLLQQQPFAPRRDYLFMSFDELLQYADELEGSLQQSQLGRQGFRQVAPDWAQLTGAGGPLGAGPLTDVFGFMGLARQRALGKGQEDILSALKDINPELAKSLSAQRAGFDPFKGRTRPDLGPYAGDVGQALWFEKLPEFEEARRKVEEERHFEFGDIYDAYLRYKQGMGVISDPRIPWDIPNPETMLFDEWMEKTPAVQAFLREEREFEQEETRKGEQRRRPPRFAAIRQV